MIVFGILYTIFALVLFTYDGIKTSKELRQAAQEDKQ